MKTWIVITVFHHEDDEDGYTWYVNGDPPAMAALKALLDKYESAGIIESARMDTLSFREPADVLSDLTTWLEGDYEDWLGGQEEHGGSDQGGADPVYLRQLRETR